MKVKINNSWYDSDKDDNILIHFDESDLKHIRTQMDETARRYSVTSPMTDNEWWEWAEIPKARMKLFKLEILGKLSSSKFKKKMKKLLRKDKNA